jgi:hypothetical protein
MIKVVAGITDYSLDEEDGGPHFYLKPYRLVLPSFLNADRFNAIQMIDSMTDLSCSDVWIIISDKEAHPEGAAIHNILKTEVDWEAAEVLEYDWAAKDQWGNIEHDPWVLWTGSTVDKSKRARELEPFIANNRQQSEIYAKGLGKDEWQSWTSEDLSRNSCWLFYYARKVCKGRLPEELDNMMTMLSFQDPEDQWVKRYFSTKRYRVRNRKALANIAAA